MMSMKYTVVPKVCAVVFLFLWLPFSVLSNIALRDSQEVRITLDMESSSLGEVLSAIEKVNDKMPSSVDADLLSQMAKRGEITNCSVDGPFAFDNAIDIHAAHHKGVKHPNAGECDVLIVPNIEAGNILYKSISYFSQGDVAGLIIGAKVPIILTSRADSEADKLNSIVCAILNLGEKHG